MTTRTVDRFRTRRFRNSYCTVALTPSPRKDIIMSYSILCVWYITNDTSTYPSNNFRPVLKRARQKDSESVIVVKRGQVHHV